MARTNAAKPEMQYRAPCSPSNHSLLHGQGKHAELGQILQRHTESLLAMGTGRCNLQTGRRRARAAASPPLAFQRPTRLKRTASLRPGGAIPRPGSISSLPKLAPHALHPADISSSSSDHTLLIPRRTIPTEPIRLRKRNHDPPQPTLPATRLPERVLRHGGILGRGGVAVTFDGGEGDMASQDHAGIGEHDDAEVEADGPEGDDDAEAVHGFGLEDRVGYGSAAGAAGAGGGVGAGGGGGRRGSGGDQARLVVDVDVDVADVVFRVGEAGCFVHGARAGAPVARVPARVVLRQNQEPRHPERGGVGGVDDAVERVEPRQRETVQRRLGADVRRQVGGQPQREEGVDVHGELERVELEAREQRQETVQRTDLVEEERERYQACAGAERHGVEEGFRAREPEESACEAHLGQILYGWTKK